MTIPVRRQVGPIRRAGVAHEPLPCDRFCRVRAPLEVRAKHAVVRPGAAAFAVGSLLPILAVLLAPPQRVAAVTMGATIASLFVSGGLAAYVGGAPVMRGALRVVSWGALAMVAASLVGRLFDVQV